MVFYKGTPPICSQPQYTILLEPAHSVHFLSLAVKYSTLLCLTCIFVPVTGIFVGFLYVYKEHLFVYFADKVLNDHSENELLYIDIFIGLDKSGYQVSIFLISLRPI